MRYSKIIPYLCLIALICCNYSQTSSSNDSEEVKIFSDKFNSFPFHKFTNFQIYKRHDSLIVLDYYKESKYIGGFLVKGNNPYFIKRKSKNAIKRDLFVRFEAYEENNFSELGLTKKQILEIINLNSKLEAIKVIYIDSFDGVLIAKQKFCLFYLLDSTQISEIPKDYKQINKKWFQCNVSPAGPSIQ